MALPDIDDLKMIIRSILNSAPGNVTISQLLNDYKNMEGSSLPYKHLGFKTIFEFLGTINDILKIPQDPNMYSVIKLIVHEKTSHLRELVVNQKSKRCRTKRFFPSEKRNCNRVPKSSNLNSRDYSWNNHNNYSTPELDYRARGYDHVKTNSSNSKCRGIVTDKLKSDIETLCINSEFVSIRTLKCNLINHADYKKMGTSNIEESINMLKYFIYINRGGVHLKNSPNEIFQSSKSDLSKYTEPTVQSTSAHIIDENEEMSTDLDEFYFDDEDYIDDMNSEVFNISENENKKIQKSISAEHNHKTNRHSISPLLVDSCQKLCTDDSLSQIDGMNQLPIRKLVNMINTDLNDLESKNSDTFTNKNNDENILISSTVHSSTHLLKKVESKNKGIPNSDVKLIPDSSKNQKDDYKSAIVDIIAKYGQPITVSEVLDIFKIQHGYTFPIQIFSCGTYMDFFRLYSNIFRLENQCSTNSIVSLEEQIVLKQRVTIRKHLCNASIFQNNAVENLKDNKLNQIEIISELLTHKNDDQQHEEPVIDNLQSARCELSIDSYEMYDSDMVLDTMKVKMRSILSKHKDGILCNDFMNVYGKEYNSYFTFSEYGFNSMRDMAFKLPSVFYVKVPEDSNETILFEASRRSEFEKKPSDPSLYYKNIPKTILYNLSQFFDTHRTGVEFNKLMTLYCTEYGRAYEPLKYGFSSAEKMFESLNKMVEIKNNMLYTIDPFAYMHYIKNIDPTVNQEKSAPILPGNKFLLNFSSSDICNGKFRYHKINLDTNKLIKVNSAEIYNPSSFYIQLAAEANNLNSFMDALQHFYNENDEKYSIRPDLIIPELTCISRFEDSDQWNRASVLKIVNEESVQVLYVDYGSIETVPKTKIRFLASKFGSYPSQAIHCTLYKFNKIYYPREISQLFVDLIEYNLQQPQFYELEAQFHPPTSKCDNEKNTVTLFLNTKNNKININQRCSKELTYHLKSHQESVRRMIYKVMEGNLDDVK